MLLLLNGVGVAVSVYYCEMFKFCFCGDVVSDGTGGLISMV